MDKWVLVITAIFGTGGLGALITLFVVPASTRNKEALEWRRKMERKVNRLTRSDAKMRAIIALLIQRDGAMVDRLRKYEPEAVIEPIQSLLERMNLSMQTIIGGDDDDDEEQDSDSKT